MSHRFATYSVEIVDNGDWISFAASLVGVGTGEDSQKIDRLALELNASLNAAHIAITNNTIMLISNELSEDSSEDRLYRDLTNFHKTHEYVYARMMEIAEDMHIRMDFGSPRESRNKSRGYLA